MNETASQLTLFASSFLSATLLPGGSELVFFAVLHNHPESLWQLLLIATIGNTLGGMVSFWMGWLIPQAHKLKYIDKLHRYGTPALTLSWVPLIGDALCLTAGWLRLNWLHAALFMSIGKFARYGMVAWLSH